MGYGSAGLPYFPCVRGTKTLLFFRAGTFWSAAPIAGVDNSGDEHQLAILLLAPVSTHPRLHQTVPLLLEKHERREGFLLFVVGQGFHLNRTKHVHVVHLSELFGHSCFVLHLKLFNTRIHQVMYEGNPKCELLPVLLGN